MAKKRGGLAGLYDRNKGLLNILAPLAAGAFGGPLAGAAVGAAMRGLDRPGKRGIGFDPFAALPGAVSGYGLGGAGQGIRQGVQGLFAPKGMPELPAFDAQRMIGITPEVGGAPTGFEVAPIDMGRAKSLLNTSASPFASVIDEGAATAKANAAKAASRSAARSAAPARTTMALPPSAAREMPSAANMFPSLDTVGRSAYGGAPAFGQTSFQPGLPGTGIGGMPAGQPGALGRFSGIGYGLGGEEPAMDFFGEPSPAPGAGTTPGVKKTPGERVKGFLKGVKENREVIGGTTRLLGELMDYQQAAALQRMNAEQAAERQRLEQEKFQFSKQQTEAERESRRRLTQLLMPLIQSQMSNVLPSPQPMNR